MFTNRGTKKEGEEEREEVIFFYGKMPLSFGTRIDGGGETEVNS